MVYIYIDRYYPVRFVSHDHGKSYCPPNLYTLPVSSSSLFINRCLVLTRLLGGLEVVLRFGERFGFFFSNGDADVGHTHLRFDAVRFGSVRFNIDSGVFQDGAECIRLVFRTWRINVTMYGNVRNAQELIKIRNDP